MAEIFQSNYTGEDIDAQIEYVKDVVREKIPKYDEKLKNVANSNDVVKYTEKNQPNGYLGIDGEGNVRISGSIFIGEAEEELATTDNISALLKEKANRTEVEPIRKDVSVSFRYRGTVFYKSDLPSNPSVGDVYVVDAAFVQDKASNIFAKVLPPPFVTDSFYNKYSNHFGDLDVDNSSTTRFFNVDGSYAGFVVHVPNPETDLDSFEQMTDVMHIYNFNGSPDDTITCFVVKTPDNYGGEKIENIGGFYYWDGAFWRAVPHDAAVQYMESKLTTKADKKETDDALAALNDAVNEFLPTKQKLDGYETKSGGYGYKITAVSEANEDGTGSYTLRTTEGLEVGMTYSVRLSGAACYAGKIVAIKDNVVTVDNYTYISLHTGADKPEQCDVKNYLTIAGHPELGDMEVGFNAIATGEKTCAQERNSTAEGRNTKVVGQSGHAEGIDTIAGYSSHAEGRDSHATGTYSHAEGRETKSLGDVSHAEGDKTVAKGAYSHAEGESTTAEGIRAHAEGGGTKAIGATSHAEGHSSSAIGEVSHAEGYQTKAEGSMSHAEGYDSVAKGAYSHAEGEHTTAQGEAAHSEGASTSATGQFSHAEGHGATSTGVASHAENYKTKSNGAYSHAEGYETTTKGRYSHAEGLGTITSSDAQHVQGRYNTEDADGKYASILGNGNGDANRSNAHTVDWNGNAWYAGEVTVGKDRVKLVTQKTVDENKTKIEAFLKTKAGKQETANALVGTASGEIIRVDDVSPISHTVDVIVRGKNLFDEIWEKGFLNQSTGENVVALSGLYWRTQNYVPVMSNVVFSATEKLRYNTTVCCYDEKKQFLGCSVKLYNGLSGVTQDIFLAGTKYIRIFIEYPDGTEDVSTLFQNVMVEEGKEATAYMPYIDPTTVTVTRGGKNFWHNQGVTFPLTVSGVTVDYDPDAQTYTFNGTSTSTANIYTVADGTDIMRINAGETWTLKVEVMGGDIDGKATSSGKITPLINTANYTNSIHANTEALYVTKTYTEVADITKMYFYIYSAGIVFNNFKMRVQFELNNKPTKFEKFKDMTDYTPAADGSCEIDSVSPMMTIFTDMDGVNIEAQYNRDTSKAFATKADNQNVANALKGFQSGTVVRLDDVSPLYHMVHATVESKNKVKTMRVDTTTNDVNEAVLITEPFTVSFKISDDYAWGSGNIWRVRCQYKSGKSVYVLDSDFAGKTSSYTKTFSATEDDPVVNVLLRKAHITAGSIYDFQVEAGTTATPYTPFVEVADVTLNAYGKNLHNVTSVFNYSYTTGITATVAEDGGIHITGTPTDGNCSLNVNLPALLPGKYTMSLSSSSDISALSQYAFVVEDGTQKTYGGQYTKGGVSFEVADNKVLQFLQIRIPKDTPIDTTIYMQIEKGSTATTYEPYQNPQAVTTNADGTVKIDSVSPTMTLVPDVDGVVIDVRYNRDVNKVIEGLINAILSLGGNV